MGTPSIVAAAPSHGSGSTSNTVGYDISWGVITGSASLGGAVPDWVAGASSQRQAASMCSSSHSFSGGHVTLSQFPSGGFDADYPCA